MHLYFLHHFNVFYAFWSQQDMPTWRKAKKKINVCELFSNSHPHGFYENRQNVMSFKTEINPAK